MAWVNSPTGRAGSPARPTAAICTRTLNSASTAPSWSSNREVTAMKPVPFDIPRLTEDGLAVLVGDRLYGDEATGRHLDNLKKMSVPREMDALGSVLTNQSRLLALPTGSTQEMIYDSY